MFDGIKSKSLWIFTTTLLFSLPQIAEQERINRGLLKNEVLLIFCKRSRVQSSPLPDARLPYCGLARQTYGGQGWQAGFRVMKLSICYVFLIQRHVKFTISFSARTFCVLKKTKNSSLSSNRIFPQHCAKFRFMR